MVRHEIDFRRIARTLIVVTFLVGLVPQPLNPLPAVGTAHAQAATLVVLASILKRAIDDARRAAKDLAADAQAIANSIAENGEILIREIDKLIAKHGDKLIDQLDETERLFAQQALQAALFAQDTVANVDAMSDQKLYKAQALALQAAGEIPGKAKEVRITKAFPGIVWGGANFGLEKIDLTLLGVNLDRGLNQPGYAKEFMVLAIPTGADPKYRVERREDGSIWKEGASGVYRPAWNLVGANELVVHWPPDPTVFTDPQDLFRGSNSFDLLVRVKQVTPGSWCLLNLCLFQGKETMQWLRMPIFFERYPILEIEAELIADFSTPSTRPIKPGDFTTFSQDSTAEDGDCAAERGYSYRHCLAPDNTTGEQRTVEDFRWQYTGQRCGSRVTEVNQSGPSCVHVKGIVKGCGYDDYYVAKNCRGSPLLHYQLVVYHSRFEAVNIVDTRRARLDLLNDRSKGTTIVFKFEGAKFGRLSDAKQGSIRLSHKTTIRKLVGDGSGALTVADTAVLREGMPARGCLAQIVTGELRIDIAGCFRSRL